MEATLHSTALQYALRGKPVFPCSLDKKPLVSGGFKSASTSWRDIHGWWSKTPNASIGIPTGSKAGIWVLDVDIDKTTGKPVGEASLAALESQYGTLPPTLAQRTGSGGRQLFFRWPADGGVRNSASKIGPNLDVRGDGGYIVVAPSSHPSGGKYAWTSGSTPLAAAPEWLLNLVRSKPETAKHEVLERAVHHSSGAMTKYGQRALEDEALKVSNAGKGSRNHTLNEAAFAVGCLVAGGEIDQDHAEAALLVAAARCGLGDSEAMKTIHSGLEAGKKTPRSAPRGEPVACTSGESSLFSHNSPTDEWNPELLKWPVLSREALPGIVGDFVGLATRDSEADPAAVLATFLTRFGAEVRGQERNKGPVHYVGETRHYPRLFAAIVGASSKARKGTSAGPVKRLFQFEESQHDLYIPAAISRGPLSTGEGLAYAVRDEAKEWQIDKKTKVGEYVVTDPGVIDKRLFVLDEELAAALACTKREGNTLSVAVRSFWDDGSYSPLIKKERTRCTDAHVSVVTHITMAELKALLDEVNSLNGFANRFLWVCSRRNKLVSRPQRMDENKLAVIQRELLARIRTAQNVGAMLMTDDALVLWDAVYPELSADHPGLGGCVINRGEAQTIRLAMVYALLGGKAHIGVDHLRAGLAFWDYCKKSALYIFDGRESNPVTQKILDALKDGPLSTTDLHRALSNHATTDGLKAALQELVASGRILEREERTARKPRKIFSLCEFGEFGEFIPEVREGEAINSQVRINSQPGEKKSEPDSDPWDGGDAVVI